MEQEHISGETVIKLIRDALCNGIVATLSGGYNQPLNKIIERSIEVNRASIEATVGGLLAEAYGPEFAVELRSEFRRKVAKILISKCESSLQKSVNDFMQDPTRRAKLLLSIEGMVKDSAI